MVPVRPVVAAITCAVLLVACGSGTDDAAPTRTAEPITTPTASPSPSPTPTTGPSAPLTGVPMDPEDADRPALAVKIENTEKARPQAGLEVADLVIEELVEGGITRFMAVFHSTVPDQLGPIRSARLVDAELLPALDGALLYSGGRPDVEAAISGTALRLTEGDPGVYRASDRSRPSNLMADGQEVYDAIADRDPALSAPPTGFVFAEQPPAGACGVCDGTAIDLNMSRASTTGWTYDQDAGVYRRDQDGVDQTTASGEPVGAANVVAVAVTTASGGCCDTSGAPYVVSRTTGEGRAVVLRDGRWYEASWEREGADDPWRLTVDGDPLPVAPGSTWLHLVPTERMPPTPEEQQRSQEPSDAPD